MIAYEAVRAHELMLNEAVSRFEHARLAPLVALNGGAVVAFLTLLGALLGKESGRRPDLWLSGFAAGAWVVGLVAAALAISSAANSQAAISATHRLLREELEDVLMNSTVGAQQVANLLRGRDPTIEPPPQSALRHPIGWTQTQWEAVRSWLNESRKDEGAKIGTRQRDELRTIATQYNQRLTARWWLSVAMFVTGAALALTAILRGSPV